MWTLFRKADDKGFDSLLRSHVRALGASTTPCEEFDPNLVSAYVEHNLTIAERDRLEGHLSECAGCRASVIGLLRFATAELGVAARSQQEAGSPKSIGMTLSRFLGLASPRWALAAAAVAVLVFSLPLIFWRDRSPSESFDQVVALNQSRESTPAASRSADEQSAVEEELQAAPLTPVRPAGQTTLYRAKSEGERQTGNQPNLKDQTPQPAAQLGGAGAVIAESELKKTEVSNSPARLDEVAAKTPSELQPTPPTIAAESAERDQQQKSLGRISKEQARRLPAEDENRTSVVKVKPGVLDASGTEREKIATIRPSDTATPRSEPGKPDSVGSRSMSRGTASKALVDDTTATRTERNRPALRDRKVGKKSFWWMKDTWVDKDYDARKQLPVVTVIRDSDIYKELLEKNNKLKTLLTGFGESERALFVFKNTVYKLVPQAK